MPRTKLDRAFAKFRKTGDAAALATTFDVAAPELLRVARHLSPDEAEAEDAVQATFAAAIERAESHDGKRPVMPWLLGILNVEVKRARERAERSIDERTVVEDAERRAAPDPARVAEDAEVVSIVEDHIERLPGTYRAAVKRHLLDGISAGEIADALGISRGALHVRLHRGMRLLRRSLPAGAALSPLIAAKLAGAGLGPSAPRGLESLRQSVLGKGSIASAAGASATAVAPWKLAAGAAAVAGGIGLATVTFDAEGDKPNAAGAHGEVIEATVPRADVDEGRTAAGDTTAGDTTLVAPRVAADVPTSRPADVTNDDVDWLARFSAAQGYSQITSVSRDVIELGEERALEVMRGVWPDLPTTNHRRQALKPFHFQGGVPYVLDVLDLGATDPDEAVRGAAFTYVQQYSLRDFTGAEAAYADWRERTAGSDRGDVLTDSTREFATELVNSTDDEAAARLATIDPLRIAIVESSGAPVAEVLRSSGARAILLRAIGGSHRDFARQGFGWLPVLDLAEQEARDLVVPALTSPSGLVEEASSGMREVRGDWVSPLLVEALAEPELPARAWHPLASAIAYRRDLRVMPDLVELLRRDESAPLAHFIATRALAPLAQLEHEQPKSADWWSDWLDRNAALVGDVR